MALDTPAAASAIILSPGDMKWAVAIAVVASFVFTLIEIPSKAKTSLRACLVGSSVFYFAILTFGNTVTTILASAVVVKMSPSLASYYFILAAFFGVFAFETILKNTNVTMFDKGVLTIQSWIDKALNAAAAAAIDRQEELKQSEEDALAKNLMARSEIELNSRILTKLGAGKVASLDLEARASSADPKLYKVFQLITALSPSERRALLSKASAQLTAEAS
jgi:hypothetical protein